jgi:hypothetical protein
VNAKRVRRLSPFVGFSAEHYVAVMHRTLILGPDYMLGFAGLAAASRQYRTF